MPGPLAKVSDHPPDINLVCLEQQPGIEVDDLPWTVLDNERFGIRTLLRAQTGLGEYLRIHFQSPVDDEFIRFTMDPGQRNVWAVWTPRRNTINDAIRLFLEPVLGAVLRLRGALCLHAGVVGFGEKAVLLAGESGAGKSTTAAALTQFDGEILADDMALISPGEKYSVVSSGLSGAAIKLKGDSIEKLNGLEELPPPWTRLLPDEDKRYFRLPEAKPYSAEKDRTLTGVYILGPRQDSVETKIRPLKGHEAVMAIIRRTYAEWILNSGQRAIEFEQVGLLASRVPVYLVQRPNDLDRLEDISRAIKSHFDSGGI